MTKINDDIVFLQENGGVLLSDVQPWPSDIDLYYKGSLNPIYSYMYQNGYTCTHIDTQHVVLRKYKGSKLYVIDIVIDMNIYTNSLYKFKLSAAGSDRIGNDIALHKCFKYLCTNRKDKIDYINSHWEQFQSFLLQEDNFSSISFSDLLLKKGNISDFYTSLHQGMYPYILSFLYRVKGHISYFRKGYSIAFIGPDGSGKTFFINQLKGIGRTKTVYMGDWFFTLQPLYNHLLKIPSPYNRFIYFIFLFENFMRYLYVLCLKNIGYIVLIDRYPGTNKNVSQTGFLGKINRLIFRFFPKPDCICFLYAPAETIFKRKQELTVDQIQKNQNELQKLLLNTNHLCLNTENLDESLNTALKNVYQKPLQ